MSSARVSLDTELYINTLRQLIAQVPKLMNKPPEHVPQEAVAAAIVRETLAPYLTSAGGPIVLREVQYAEGRSNLILEYPATGNAAEAHKDDTSKPKCVSFVGSHFDVVHADAATWEFDPFTLEVVGDELRGRGTTDCLGHVALVTCIFVELAKREVALDIPVYAVLIADEEIGGCDPDIGVTRLMQEGELGCLQGGPVYWLDCADMQPNIGSGGVVQWTLKATGKMAHSGFPHHGVNAIELCNAALAYVQKRFYERFGTHEREAEYGFPCSSSLKPTRVESMDGSLNQIPDTCQISGDIRLVPFYKIADCMQFLDSVVAELNETRFAALEAAGPDSKFHLLKKDSDEVDVMGTLEMKWHSGGMDGLACDLDTPGFLCLAEATRKHVGECKPLADTGSLPLVAELKAAGYDLQTIGYGVEEVYHGLNEFARLSDFQTGFHVLWDVIEDLNRQATA